MKILTSAYALNLAGVPTFTLAMYNELIHLGHEVTVYSTMGGPLESQMKTIKKVEELERPDVIISQHNISAADLKKKFPSVPHIFYSHGVTPDAEQPPPFDPDYYILINEETRDNYVNKGANKNKMAIIRDFIDTERFKPTKKINKKLTNVLFISNYKKWTNYKAVAGACDILGLNLVCHGSPYGRNFEIEKAINQSDLVISWARGILEAMACGRAALSFDRKEGDGYISLARYFEARGNNFSGRYFKHKFNAESLATEMQKYDPECGEINRRLILKYHNVEIEVQKILDIINLVINNI